MPLPYKPVQSTIAAKDGKKKWHPQVVRIGKAVTTQQVAQLISERSSLSPGDTHNVMRNFAPVMKELLMNGRSVNIDGLGSFRIVCRSSGGVDTSQEVTPHQIKRLRIQFTPTGTRTVGEGTTRSMFTGAEFVRVDSIGGKSATGSGESEGEGGGYEQDPNA